MAVTLKDVARELGVSITTVGLALKRGKSKRYRLAAKTVDLVCAKAKEMGYRPNNLAVGLKKNCTRTIGVLVSRLDFCIGEVLDDIVQEISQDFTPLLSVHNWRGSIERRELETFVDKRVDGIIAAFSGDNDSIPVYRQVPQKQHIPIVLMGRSIPNLNLKVIRSDHYKNTYEVTKTMQSLGYSNIHYLGLRLEFPSLESFTLREQGYRDAMKNANMQDHIQVTINRGKDVWDRKNLRKFAVKILDMWQKNRSENTVLFAENDLLAYEILDECCIRRIKIPNDLSIMGIGDYPLSAREFIGLSTVAEERNGKLAAQVLLKLMRGESCREKTFLVPSKIILRKTTRTI